MTSWVPGGGAAGNVACVAALAAGVATAIGTTIAPKTATSARAERTRRRRCEPSPRLCSSLRFRELARSRFTPRKFNDCDGECSCPYPSWYFSGEAKVDLPTANVKGFLLTDKESWPGGNIVSSEGFQKAIKRSWTCATPDQLRTNNYRSQIQNPVAGQCHALAGTGPAVENATFRRPGSRISVSTYRFPSIGQRDSRKQWQLGGHSEESRMECESSIINGRGYKLNGSNSWRRPMHRYSCGDGEPDRIGTVLRTTKPPGGARWHVGGLARGGDGTLPASHPGELAHMTPEAV